MIAGKVFLNTESSPLAFTFWASQDSAFNLQIQVYFNAIADAIKEAISEGIKAHKDMIAAIIAQQEAENKANSQFNSTIGGTTLGDLLGVPPAQDPGLSVGTSVQQEFSSVLSSTATVTLTWQGDSMVWTTKVASGVTVLVTQATLPIPESPLSVEELPDVLPGSQYVDVSQEPTFTKVLPLGMSGQLLTPSPYNFSGQDLVYGDYRFSNPEPASLDVFRVTTINGQPNLDEPPLLGTITNPRLVVRPQELRTGLPFPDFADPFFVADTTRTYLVQPQSYTISSSPLRLRIANLTETLSSSSSELATSKTRSGTMPETHATGALVIGSGSAVSQVPSSTRYVFETFYHPYARTFLRELEIGGVSQLMARHLQVNPQTVRGWTPDFDFKGLYQPQGNVATPYPGVTGAPDPGESALDFTAGSSGAYSLYNWEMFYHIPMFVASLLMQNQKYRDAMTWLEYIFNPTDSSGGDSPQRFWQMAPLNAKNKQDWIVNEIQKILTILAADTQQGTNDS
ncbi:MAG TPA: hypothetical protein VNY05_16990 [Candidatus Acidoferrales bacterium]|jgi:hypothetical protein|nr:hypothetical protein [Candidatus Acidoferrales bacterium]